MSVRALYGAPTLAAAEQALERFADRWDTQYPASPDYSPTPKIDEREGFCCQDNPHSNLVTGSSRA
jgi:hypothetical protein